jgi:hypothetical protein
MDHDLLKLFCRESKEIKALLGAIVTATGAGEKSSLTEDLILQFPEDSTARTIEAKGTVKRTKTVNKRLIYLSVDIPDGMIATINRDGLPLMWFTAESGAIEFKKGLYFSEFGISITNNGTYEQAFSVRTVFT